MPPRSCILIVALLAACGDPGGSNDTASDTGRSEDADAGIDAGPAPDGSIFEDAQTSADAEPPVDAGPRPRVYVDLGPVAPPSDGDTQHEPSIAVDSTGAIAVVWQLWQPTEGRITLGYRIELPGAEPPPAVVLEPPPPANIMANAKVAARPGGGFVVTWVSLRRTSTGRANIHVWAATADAGASRFQAPVDVADTSESVFIHDLPSLIVTPSGRIHVVWTKATDGGSTVEIAHAWSDDGTVWQRDIVTGSGSAGSFRNFASVCRGPDSEAIFSAWFDTDLGIALSKLDPGGTWTDPITVSSNSEANMLVGSNTSCVSDGARVWVTYGLGQSTSSATVPTWDTFRVARVDEVGDGVAATGSFRPEPAQVAMTPNTHLSEDGMFQIFFYGGASAGDDHGAIRVLSAIDGVAVGPSEVLFEPIRLESNRIVDKWLGDYMGVVSSGGGIWIAATDNLGASVQIRAFRAD